jgi:hypothetical protein
MIFGHNTNVSVGAYKYHVQTEDAGAPSALIDTTVYAGGRVLHRRTNNYLDLLPLNADTEKALKLRLDEQHRQVLEEIRTGVLCLPPPTPSAAPPPTKSVSSQAVQKPQARTAALSQAQKSPHPFPAPLNPPISQPNHPPRAKARSPSTCLTSLIPTPSC